MVGVGPPQAQGPGDVSVRTHLGRILPWLGAGKDGARLLGYPGRRGQGSRPEVWVVRGCGPVPPGGKALSHPTGSTRSCRRCLVLAGFRPGWCRWSPRQGEAARVRFVMTPKQAAPEILPAHLFFFFFFFFPPGFLAFTDFSLKKWFPKPRGPVVPSQEGAERGGMLPWGQARMEGLVGA